MKFSRYSIRKNPFTKSIAMFNKFMRLIPSSPAENTVQSVANQVLSNLRQELRNTLAHLHQLEIAIEHATVQIEATPMSSQTFEDISIQAKSTIQEKNEDIHIQLKTKEQQTIPVASQDYNEIEISLKGDE